MKPVPSSRHNPSRLTIRARILLLVAAVLIPYAVLVVWGLRTQAAQVGEVAYRQAGDRSAAVADQVALYLRTHKAVLERIQSQPKVLALDGRDCDAAVAEFTRLHPDFTSLGLRLRDGTRICAQSPNLAAENVAAEPWFQRGLNSPGFLAGDAQRGAVSGRWVAPLSLPIRDRTTGEVRGMVALALDLARLNQQLFGRADDASIVSLLDSSGQTLLRSEEFERWAGRPSPLVRDAPSVAAPTGRTHGPGPDGVPRYWATVPVDGTAWRVVTGVAEASAHAGFWRAALEFTALGLLLTGLASALAIWQSRAISQPIHSLARLVAQGRGGDRSARAEPAGPVELVEVALQIHAMLDERDLVEGRLKHFLEFSSDWYYEVDVNDRFTYVSDSLLALRGIKASDVLGKHIRDYLKVSWRPDHLAEVLRRVEAHEAIRDLEVCRLTDAGGEHWVRLNGAPVFGPDGAYLGYRGTGTEITDEVRRRRHLQLLETSVANLRDVIMITEGAPLDEPGPRIVFVNQAFERATGYRRDEVIGRSPRFLQGPKTAGAELRRLSKALRSQQPVRVELINYNKDRREYWVEIDLVPVPAPDGSMAHVVAIERDITERKQVEGRLREAHKLEAVGTLAGGIAHDFNNIIAAILGNVQLAQRGLEAGRAGEAVVSLDEIAKSGRRARALVQQILAFSRRSPEVRTPQDLRLLVEGDLALLRAMLPAGVELRLDLADQPLPVRVNANQFAQVLVNLVTNAWHAMAGRDGTIRLGLVAATSQGEDGVEVAGARLTVRDDGDGMDEATLARIFEPFFTTKPVGKGTGLGLAVVHGIVHQHGGTIRAQSSPGAGTLVEVWLPLDLA